MADYVANPLAQAIQPDTASQAAALNLVNNPAMLPPRTTEGVPVPMADSFAQGDPDAMAMLGVRPQPGAATADLGSFYRALTGGSPAAITQNLSNASQNLKLAAEQKKEAIGRAIGNIQAWNQGNTANVPELAFAAGMLAPTRTGGFAESLSSGINSALPQMLHQRQMGLETARAVGQLGVQGADVDLQEAALAQEEVMKRYEMAQRALQTQAYAGSRTNVAEIKAQAMTDAAQIAASGHVTQVQINALAKKYQVDTEQAAKMIAAAGQYLRGAGIEKHGEAAITTANNRAANGLTTAEQARLSGQAWHEASSSLDWMRAKDDAAKLFILNRSRQARMLPPLTALPAAPQAAAPTPQTLVPQGKEAAGAPATAPAAPSGKPDLKDLLFGE